MNSENNTGDRESFDKEYLKIVDLIKKESLIRFNENLLPCTYNPDEIVCSGLER